ncbi:MAG: DUF1902 domain-containing protein [Cardiobacterium hominis]
MQKRSRDFSVEITHDPESGYWTAVCEALGIVTEAENYEALIKRVWAVAPEMYELCGYGTVDDNFRLTFQETLEGQEIRLYEAL